MAFFILGVVLLVLKLLGFPGITLMSWWWVAAPFALALAWWALADALGFTQAAAMRRVSERAAKRRRDQMVSLGLRPGTGDRPRR